MKNLISAAMILGTVVCASAADKTGEYTVRGSGNASCADWIKEQGGDGSKKLVYHAWVAGYVTGYNKWVTSGKEDIVDSASYEPVFAAVTQECARQQSATIELAAERTIEHLKEQAKPAAKAPGKK